jgi:hypothetical protein
MKSTNMCMCTCRCRCSRRTGKFSPGDTLEFIDITRCQTHHPLCAHLFSHYAISNYLIVVAQRLVSVARLFDERAHADSACLRQKLLKTGQTP